MAISGSFMSTKATVQPMAAQPAPNERHGAKSLPDNAWSPPVESTGGGADWAESVTPEMNARGIMTDSAHQYGHVGTSVTRFSRRPFLVSRDIGMRNDAQYLIQGAAQQASSDAHGDLATRSLNGHHYNPMPQRFAGESYDVDQGTVDIPTSVNARTAIHGQPGGQFMDGESGSYQVTGARRADNRRWARANYSSPTLGATYSRNTLRGVLPQAIANPVTQSPLSGVRDSGIWSNTRFLGKQFTTPALFRTPPSESEQQMAQNQTADTGGTIGVGF